MTAISKLDKVRNLWIVSEKLVHSGFARVLGTDPTTMLSNNSPELKFHVDSKQFSLHYTVLPRSCVQPVNQLDANESNSFLPLSAFVALFDEVTTWAICAEDRGGRPGVSTHLSASFVGKRRLGPGDLIGISVCVSKVGKVLAFAEATATCSHTGQVISVGRHTKYLPSGSSLQDLALGPLMPVTKLYTSMLPSPSMREVPTMTHLISLQDRQKHQAKVYVSVDHCNPLGFFHGGCQAICMERLCQHMNEEASSMTSASDLNLRSMSISYMSSGKHEISLYHDTVQRSRQSHTCVVRAHGLHNVCVSEGVFHYD